MKKICVFLAGIVLFTTGFGNKALACTTFCLKNSGDVLFGKNYDWMIGDGIIFVNKRGLQKEGADDTNAAKWVSKYGSVTFNQYGRENPHGGINEAGLVIELMWLDESTYPAADSRPAVDVLEWIQYNLDQYATVDEVLRNAGKVRISSDVKLHYMVNDKDGHSATVEFLGGNLVSHTGERLPVATLTNDTYDNSLAYAKKTDPAKAEGAGSLERFARAAEKTGDFDKKPRNAKEAVDYAFEILTNVAQPNGGTQWSIVYDQKRSKIYFRTHQSPQIKSIDTRMFNYACGTAVKMLDINSKAVGDVTPLFTDYTRAANRNLIERSFNGTEFLKSTPALVRNLLASYPEDFTCSTSPPVKSVKALSTGTGVVSESLLKTFPIYYFYKALLS